MLGRVGKWVWESWVQVALTGAPQGLQLSSVPSASLGFDVALPLEHPRSSLSPAPPIGIPRFASKSSEASC
eukprot:4117218-Amphidinium_carterae.1